MANENYGLYITAIVAVVAIVGLVILVTGGQTTQAPTYQESPTMDTEMQENMGGEAFQTARRTHRTEADNSMLGNDRTG